MMRPGSDHAAPQGLRSERGQALVEFALILPIFALLILGLMDFGTAYNDHNNMTQLAAEAARFAAVDNCGTGCTSAVTQVLADADNTSLKNGASGSTGPDQALRICFDYPNVTNGTSTTAGVGDPVRATVETNYRWMPYLGIAKVQLKATATARIEVAPTGGSSDVYSTTIAPTLVVGTLNCSNYTS